MDARTIQKETLERAEDLLERLSSEGSDGKLFTTAFKDRFIEDVRSYERFLRAQTSQDATEAIVAVFERTMTGLTIEDDIKAPLRSTFVLRLMSLR